MKKRFYLSLFLVLLALSGIAQITTNELPPSFYEPQLKLVSDNVYIKLEEPNLKPLKKQDKIDEADKSIPWRFGELIPVNFSLNKDGITQEDNKGNITWKLQIKAPGALSINLNFNDFFLSKNSKLFIYGEAYKDVLGALTYKNNKEDRQFAIRPIKGELIHLELIVPKSEFSENKISIHELIYGYRDIYKKANKTFRSSGNCNVNINCEEGDEWQKIKRSIAMITTSANRRLCTGVLLNNARQDTTPYLLTGAHCNVQNDAIFIFGYESAKCDPNTDGILSNSVTGARVRASATSNFTDFELLELTNRPPKSYNVYYAGWSAEDVTSQRSTTIHHPRGDVMKISVDQDSSISSGYYSKSGNTHWTVANWETGTTEPSSSGAPLFNENQRVIGSLQGGDASCSNNAQDYYGKFSTSWADNSTKSRQLKAWLDPDSTGILVLDGLSADTALYKNDIAIISIGGINTYSCDTSFNPFIFVRNEGNDTVFSIEVEYNIDGGINTSLTHNDTILSDELVKIDLGTVIVSSGYNIFNTSANIKNITDQDSSNNKKDYPFLSATSNQTLTIEIKTDDYGAETSWALYELASGIKISSEGPYASVTGGQTITKNICIPDSSCFYTDLFDSQGDGFNGPFFGNGHFLVKDQGGDTLLFENNFKTDFLRDTFCLNTVFSNINEFENNSSQIKIFPNPVSTGQLLTVDLMNNAPNEISLRLIDPMGRVILENNSTSIRIPTNLSRGFYFIEILSEGKKMIGIEKILIQ